MAANDPGIVVVEPLDPAKGVIDFPDDEKLESPERIRTEENTPVAPDQFDPRWETSKWEIWAYYAYYSTSPPYSPLRACSASR